MVVGTPVAKPTPVFTKLDPSVVEEELARYAARAGGDAAAPGGDETPSEAPTRAWSAVPEGRAPETGRRMQPMPVRGPSRGPSAPKTWTPEGRSDAADPDLPSGERPNRHRRP